MSQPLVAAALAEQAAHALRAPFVPSPVRDLAACGDYLAFTWPQLAPSLETAGFLSSALYMADMALDAAETVYQPILSRQTLLDGALDANDLTRVEEVLDVFHWCQPQLLLALSALAEGWHSAPVGGQGRPDPRQGSARERTHLATSVEFASPRAGPLPEIAQAMQLEVAPDLYRAMAVWPGYLQVAWEELQHLVTYPLFRQRGRALYFYARSSTRFLAAPIEVSREILLARGARPDELDRANRVLEAALPALSMMLMHCAAMRVGLGLTTREVVKTL